MKTRVVSICVLIGFLLSISGCGQKVNKLLQNGEIDKAIRYCEKRQDKSDCIKAIAYYYFKNKDITNAEKYYLKLDEPNFGLNKIADFYFKNDDFLNAEKYFNLTDSPNEGLLLIADTYKKKGKYSDAEIYYEKVGLLKEGLNRIADALFLDLNYSRAITYYERIGKKYSIEELETLHKDIIEEKELSGSISLKYYTTKKKVSIFNPRMFGNNNLYISYELENELKNELKNNYFLIISYYGKKIVMGSEYNVISINQYSPKYISGYYHYSMSLNTITVQLQESAIQAKEIQAKTLTIYLIDTEGSSKPVSNDVLF